jgi:hypothetical protein
LDLKTTKYVNNLGYYITRNFTFYNTGCLVRIVKSRLLQWTGMWLV